MRYRTRSACPRQEAIALALLPANHYELNGYVTGTVDTSSVNGKPVVSLDVGGVQAQSPQLSHSSLGLQIDAALDARPDLDSRDVVVFVPRVNLDDTPVTFAAVALVVTARSSIGGPGLVDGAVHSYEVHPLAGQASIVEY
jgi:hypothetical protein